MAHAYYYRDERDRPTVMPVAHLSFRYGPLEIDSSERASRLETFQGGQVYALSRRRAKERDAFKRLSGLDFLNARSVYPFLEGGHFQDLTFKEAHDWLDFLNHQAAELRAEAAIVGRSRRGTHDPGRTRRLAHSPRARRRPNRCEHA